ncbi:MAG: glycoside hydrolase family 3 C-terminal domain-containing protein [Acidobacteria bacterium]|nr:glycoside hydrolase family 3 C-terminal domain-containing protein [Acidobacteriota bacterium]
MKVLVLLAIGFNPQSESEGWDRTFSLPPGQDELIGEISAINKYTVVVVASGGAVDAALGRSSAVVDRSLVSRAGGGPGARLDFGETKPSGHLPVFERRPEDNPTHDHYYPQTGSDRIVYQEGVFVGSRGYEKNQIKPLFPIGFGLSYTSLFRVNSTRGARRLFISPESLDYRVEARIHHLLL